jgi:hypothetical protein
MEMGLESIALGVAFPILIGLGVTIAVSDSNEIEFWVARACFILAALDALYFTVVWLWFTEELEARVVAVGAGIAAVIIVSLVYILRWVDYRQDRASTVLRPGSTSTPPLPAGCNPPADAMVVLFGSGVAWSSNFPFTILTMSGTKMLVVDKIGGKINVKLLRIFDDRGNIIGLHPVPQTPS